MNNKDKIFILIPVYNDSAVISDTIQELNREGYFDIIIVDDGSTNNFYEKIKHFNIYFLRHTVNLGQGAALKTGFDYASKIGAEVVVTFDADGQHDARDIKKIIIPVFNKEVDVVLGSRFLRRSNTGIKVGRKIILKIGRWVNYFFSGILLSDAHNGFRVFNRTALNTMVLTENRMVHASEILFEIKRRGLKYKEAGVNVRYTAYSRTKGQSGWNSLRIFLDIIIHKISMINK